MLAGTDDHLTWLSPVILNLENMGLTHLESEIRVPMTLNGEHRFVNKQYLAGVGSDNKEST